MSTEEIVAICVLAAIALLALVFMMPRMRERSRIRRQEHELQRRRDRVSSEHRQEAELREQRAGVAEQRADIAAHEARREREEAQLHEKHAALHEEGLADQELVGDDERDRFAGTSLDHDTRTGEEPHEPTRERDRMRDNVTGEETTTDPGRRGPSRR